MKIADVAAASALQKGRLKATKKGWLTTVRLVNNEKTKDDLRARLQRSDSRRTLIANNAAFARTVLEEFAGISRPKYSLCAAIVFGSVVDIFVLLRWPVGNPLMKAIIRLGGPEQLRFLFCVATFDANRDGKIDDEEWARYEKLGDMLISDSVQMCGNIGIVGALLLGQTHLITMGRPVPFELSVESADEYGEWLLWLAYSFNAASECAAFFTVCIAVITRNNLTNILPTRELKIDMLRSSNALGIMGVSLMLTLWFFLLSSISGTLVASPDEGVVGCALFAVCLLCCCYFIAPIRYVAVLLLHEEIKRFMIEESGSFKKQASQAGSFAKTALGAMATGIRSSRLTNRGSKSRSPSVATSTPTQCTDGVVSPAPQHPTDATLMTWSPTVLSVAAGR